MEIADKRGWQRFYLHLVDSRCSPPDPLSNRFFFSAHFSVCLRGGVILRGDYAPSLTYTPLQPAIIAVSYQCFWLERGRGEVSPQQPKPNRTLADMA
jgi:hypothetical protein